jgi:hypothetical protein
MGALFGYGKRSVGTKAIQNETGILSADGRTDDEDAATKMSSAQLIGSSWGRLRDAMSGHGNGVGSRDITAVGVADVTNSGGGVG